MIFLSFDLYKIGLEEVKMRTTTKKTKYIMLMLWLCNLMFSVLFLLLLHGINDVMIEGDDDEVCWYKGSQRTEQKLFHYLTLISMRLNFYLKIKCHHHFWMENLSLVLFWADARISDDN